MFRKLRLHVRSILGWFRLPRLDPRPEFVDTHVSLGAPPCQAASHVLRSQVPWSGGKPAVRQLVLCSRLCLGNALPVGGAVVLRIPPGNVARAHPHVRMDSIRKCLHGFVSKCVIKDLELMPGQFFPRDHDGSKSHCMLRRRWSIDVLRGHCFQ